MVGAPVTALPAGRVLRILLFWYQKYLLWKYDSNLYLFFFFIQCVYSLYMGNFLEIRLNSQMDFTRKSVSETWNRSVQMWHFCCLRVLRDVLTIDRTPLITRQNLTTHISKSFFLQWLLVAFFFVKMKEMIKKRACISYCCYYSCLCPVLAIIFWIALNWDCNINGYVQRR